MIFISFYVVAVELQTLGVVNHLKTDCNETSVNIINYCYYYDYNYILYRVYTCIGVVLYARDYYHCKRFPANT